MGAPGTLHISFATILYHSMSTRPSFGDTKLFLNPMIETCGVDPERNAKIEKFHGVLTCCSFEKLLLDDERLSFINGLIDEM